jgi:hypothetical protein
MADKETCQQGGANCTEKSDKKDLAKDAVEEIQTAAKIIPKIITYSTTPLPTHHEIPLAITSNTLLPVSTSQSVTTSQSVSSMQPQTTSQSLSTTRTSSNEQIRLTNYSLTITTHLLSTTQALSTEPLLSTTKTPSSAKPLNTKEHLAKAAKIIEEANDPCISKPCQDNVRCTSINSTDYTCGPCPPGYKVPTN